MLFKSHTRFSYSLNINFNPFIKLLMSFRSYISNLFYLSCVDHQFNELLLKFHLACSITFAGIISPNDSSHKAMFSEIKRL